MSRPKKSARPLVLREESHDLPIVDVALTLRDGSAGDPAGREGLTRMLMRMLRMGTARLPGAAVEEQIARLGARLTIETDTSYVRMHATVIRRNLEPLFALLAELLTRPALRKADLAQVKRETQADLVALRDDDRALAARGFRRCMFADHPYGRSALGTAASIDAIERRDLLEHYARLAVAGNVIVGAAGAIDEEQLQRLVEVHLAPLPAGPAPRVSVPPPRLERGRRVLIVDKPQRSQSQLIIGTLGTKAGAPDSFPLSIANTAFGGTFTSRLMREVRSKRGWSYGASSHFEEDRQRDAWSMSTFPAVKDVVACAQLQLELLEAWVENGITTRELRFAKSYLSKSHCFDIDTAPKRLDDRVDLEIYNLPAEHVTHYVDRVRGVSLTQANEAVRRCISPRNLVIALVATASEVEAAFAKLPGVRQLQVQSYDSAW